MGRAKTGWVKIGGGVEALQAEPALEFGGQDAPGHTVKHFYRRTNLENQLIYGGVPVFASW